VWGLNHFSVFLSLRAPRSLFCTQGDLEYEKGLVQRLTNEMRRMQSEQMETTVLKPRRNNSDPPAEAAKPDQK
jgi:hypothetical protein